jgi:proteasome lid subunit RPN8/RPN11
MDDLHSSKQPPEDEDRLLPAIGAAVAQLRGRFPEQKIPVLQWNASFVAVPLTVNVELPGRGPVNGVDIRKREPILVLFDKESFPYIAPRVYADRFDFPKTSFPHLNATARGVPAWLCLHRGSIDAWFAEHTVIDLVHRAAGWLRDAARNRLVPEGDGFEPTRSAETTGTFVYTPSLNIDRIVGHWRGSVGAAGYSVLAFDLLDDDGKAAIGESGYSVRQIEDVPAYVYKEHRALAELLNDAAKEPAFKGKYQRRLFGLQIWAAENEVSSEYFGELPETLGDLEYWATRLGLPLTAALSEYLANDLHLFAGVPIILAVKRPGTILGTDSEIELLNFLVTAGGDHWPKEGAWDPGAKARLSDHRTSLTPEFARRLSAIEPAGVAEPTIIFGAGALGSKVASHLARSGSVAIRIVDNAKISPHNLVRHALGGSAIGLSKAEALKDELVKLYPGQVDLPIEAKTVSALACLRTTGFFDGHANLVDMTASNTVFNCLRDADLPETVRVHRAEIADQGRLGFVSVEGVGRNPRLDDLQMLMFDSAMEEIPVATWLNEVKSAREHTIGSHGLEDIQIGLSCSSATMRLADEVVSFHAAAATRRLRPYLAKDGRLRGDGAIYRSFLGEDGDGKAWTQTYTPTVVVDADLGWEIRIAAAAAEKMTRLLRQRSPSETGGILVGRISPAKKIIYVTRLVRAPADSRGTPYAFRRGTEQLPEALDQIQCRTGGLLSYVGEWHTHPMGGSDLSGTDKEAVISLRSILDRAGLPTLVAIVTPDEIRPHLFEPTSPPVTAELPKRHFFGYVLAALDWRPRSGKR